jgi:hypothetical protein
MGLFLVKNQVETQGAQIVVKSHRNDGATFKIYLMNKIDTLCVIDDDDIYTSTIKKTIKIADATKNTIFFDNGKVALDYLMSVSMTPHFYPN